MLRGSRKARSTSLAFSAHFAPLLSAERSLLIAHLAQAGSHGLKLSRFDVIDGGMVREADRLMFFVTEETAFELAGDRHFSFLHLISWKIVRRLPVYPAQPPDFASGPASDIVRRLAAQASAEPGAQHGKNINDRQSRAALLHKPGAQSCKFGVAD
jgi:hypothetical protein